MNTALPLQCSMQKHHPCNSHSISSIFTNSWLFSSNYCTENSFAPICVKLTWIFLQSVNLSKHTLCCYSMLQISRVLQVINIVVIIIITILKRIKMTITSQAPIQEVHQHCQVARSGKQRQRDSGSLGVRKERMHFSKHSMNMARTLTKFKVTLLPNTSAEEISWP